MFMTKTIVNNLLHKYSTRLHPFEKRPPLPGTRAKLEFDAETCILCKLCAQKCPTSVITVDVDGARWKCNLMGCVSCGVCADVCPTKSITMSEEYRAPFTERTTLDYQCKPRVRKSKDGAVAAKEADAGQAEDAGKASKTAPSVKLVKGAATDQEKAKK